MSRPRGSLPKVPTELAALAAGVAEATVRKWASRGKLTRYGRPGRAEYDLGELYEILERNRRPDSGSPVNSRRANDDADPPESSELSR